MDTGKVPSSIPPRGTRPGNRRALTLVAATELFYRRGYARVAMTDIASAVNVGASAIYRHFSGKSDILMAVIRSGFAPYLGVIEDAPRSADTAQDLDCLLVRLAECAIDHREIGVLWQREARNLDQADQDILRGELSENARTLARFVERARPGLDGVTADLIAWCTLGALVSVSFHSLTLPRGEYIRLLVDLASTVAAFVPPTGPGPTGRPEPILGASPSPSPSPSRKESLIARAMELFAERGYGAVGVDDIASAAGIAGPSIYSHFAGKHTILIAAIKRGNDLLHHEAALALASDTSTTQKLRRLVVSYVAVANTERAAIRTLLSEMDQLPAEDRRAARLLQHQYIDIWTEQLVLFSGADVISARIRVQAVLLVVNDAVQTPHLRDQPGFEGTLSALAAALLGVEDRD